MLRKLCLYLVVSFFVSITFTITAFAMPKVTVYTELSPPFIVQEQGKVSGIATDRVISILEEAGIDYELVMYPWARSLMKFQSDPYALLYSVGRTPEREKQFHWIAPVARFEVSLVSLANRDDIQFKSLDDVRQFSVVAQRDDISYNWSKGQGLIENDNLLVCPDIECSWRFLMSGHVDLMLEDYSLVDYTAPSFGYNAQDIKEVMPVPSLAIDAYLVANDSMPDFMVEKLQKAAEIVAGK